MPKTKIHSTNIGRPTKNDRNANPSQNEKSWKPTHKLTQIAAHFILTDHPQAHPPPRQIC
jgi:hypothetical protein